MMEEMMEKENSAKRLKCDFSQPPDPLNKFKPILNGDH